MFARRLLTMGLVCGLLLLGTAHAAQAKTCMCATDAFATTPHDTAVDVDLEVAGDWGPVGEIQIVESPKHGTATATVPPGSDGRIHYVPDPGYVGSDVMTYLAIAFNGDLQTPVGPATVSIDVTGPAPTTTTTAPTTTTTVVAAASTVPATTAPTTVAAEQLPRTGSTSGLTALAGVVILAGVSALWASRRRVGHSRR